MSLPSAMGPQSLAALVVPVRERLARFIAEPAVRRSLPAIAVAGVVGLGLVGWLMLRAPDMLPLFPGMADADKSRVVTVLTGAGIAADLNPASGEVQVPVTDYQRAKMLLAAQGLPQSAPDAEAMLDKLQLGSSSAVEALRLKQAQEAELSRSIAMIAGVGSARVHLAIPERSAFVRDSLPPTASVVLALRPGFRLAGSQVEAIVNLVSASVPGLTAENVSLVDQRGQLLSDGAADPLARLTARQMQERARLEDLYRNRIMALLSPLTGPENLSVQVSLDMDFSVTEVQDQQIIPDSATVLTEENQSSTTDQPAARGIPGGVSNTPPAAATATTGNKPETPGAASTAQSQSASSKRTYDVGRRVQTTRPGTPRVVKINAAVLVGTVAGQDANAVATRLADMERLVKGAVGFDQARGDAVTVLAQPFIQTATDGTAVLPDTAGSANLLADWRVLSALGAGAALAIGGIAFLMLRRRGGLPPPRMTPTLSSTAMTLEDVLPQLSDGVVPETAEDQQRLERRVQLARAAMSAGNRDEKFAILRQIATEDPARVASVLRKMMKDEIDRVV